MIAAFKDNFLKIEYSRTNFLRDDEPILDWYVNTMFEIAGPKRVCSARLLVELSMKVVYPPHRSSRRAK